jgi:hypothetical protein
MPTASVKPTTAGMPGKLEVPIAEVTSTAVGKAATAETLDIAGNQQQNQKQQQKEDINSSIRDSGTGGKLVAEGMLTTVKHWQQQ